MPYRICKTIDVESGHMLSKHKDNCKFPHGHSRRIEIVLEAESLDANDMVCDFGVLKDAVGEIVGRFDHAMCINSSDPRFAQLKELYGDRVIGFDKVDPTTEIMAKAIFDVIKKRLAEYAAAPGNRYPMSGKVRLAKLRVWETRTAWAEYEE